MTTESISTDGDDLRILRAITALEAKLSLAINSGLGSVQAALAALTESHHHAMLEQERRNAGFATQVRMDELIDQVHSHSNKIQALDTKLLVMDRVVTMLQDQLRADEQEAAGRHFGLFQTASGWVFAIVMLLLSTGAGALLAHIH